jgi:hypothetical protein
MLPGGEYDALANDSPGAWGLATPGVDGAYFVTPTLVFDGVDIGSPGHLQGETPDTCGPTSMLFDGDGNGVVDLLDFAYFVLCHEGAGPGAPGLPSDCACFDADFDGDVDLADFARLQSEPGMTP